MKTCRTCKSTKLVNALDLGHQPISNRFTSGAQEDEYTHAMVMAQCDECCLVQLIDGPPSEDLIPPFDWISYNEPESHLDDLVDKIADLTGLSSNTSVCGISFKDKSTLRRLKDKGAGKVWLLDPNSDLGIEDPSAGIETIQARLTPDRARNLAEKHGPADIVVVRHILEHAHDTGGFLAAIKQLSNPEGHIVFEVPDCSRALETLDYSCPWEEHVLYFTQNTIERSLISNGFSPSKIERYPYPFEDSLVVIGGAQHDGMPGGADQHLDKRDAENDRRLWRSYSQSLAARRVEVRSKLDRVRDSNGKIALFGAGHLAAFYINLFELGDLVEFVVDDNPSKKGLRMPGSGLDIHGSEMLLNDDIKLCLLCLSPESEGKVIQNNQKFVAAGGTFSSIFPSSDLALKV
ncbi:MAG: class I SAM-dependent methyltransferase [SAR202 cluster bacterium]|nr:class I SAM-dependent methyltransferase [SAR202 cluster bacterium]|tara:strand:- start:427 stop:1641 length:1215 start_codon:yes stop_codon:yes gene_type:complete